MKITELLASLMKKKKEEPALNFEIQFQYERATIRTVDGETFDDWQAVSERWPVEYPPAYRISGPSFDVVYLVHPDRLLLVQVACAALIDGGDGQRLWQGFSEPRAEFITGRKAAEILTIGSYKIPAIVKALAKAEEDVLLERDAQPARPLELWANTPGFNETTSAPRSRDSFFSMAWGFATHSKNLLKILNRWRREGVVNDRDARDCACTFNRRFRPNADRWLMEKKTLPPESLGIHELSWPADLREPQKVILELQSLVALPLASAIAGFILHESHDCVPNAAERKRGFDMLEDAKEDIARLTGTLMELLQQARQNEYEAERSHEVPTETVVPQIPSPVPDAAPTSMPNPPVPDINAEQEAEYRRCVMERTTDGWVFQFRGSKYSFPPSLGLGCIHLLLKKAGKQIDAIDLDAEVRFQPSIRNGNAGEKLDRTAISQMNKRLEDVREEIKDAQSLGGESLLEKLMIEKEQIEQQLASDLGLKGRSRVSHAENEAARLRVTQNLKGAYKKIRATCPDLAAHFESNIETGASVRFLVQSDFSWEAI